MMRRSADHRAAVLQCEIRRAGDATDRVRCALWCAVVVPFGGLIISGGVFGLSTGAGLAALLTETLAGCAAAFAFGTLASVPLSWLYRRLRGAQMRRALREIPRQHAADILLPLRHDRTGDTRKLAASLLRHVQVPSELVPAIAAGGRGDEPVAL
jgi:hypothetical protein